MTYADIIHVRPRTWGRSYPAPTQRPWKQDGGIGDDDLSGHYDGEGRELTNAEFEAKLDEYRANGQTVEFRAQLGRQRAPGRDAWARKFNREIAKEERDKFREVYPDGCPHCGKG